MKTLPVVLCLLLTGCTGPMFRATTGVLGGAGGAVAGSALTRGKPAGAAVGAAIGVAGSEVFHHFRTKAEKEAWQRGYEAAWAEAVSEQQQQQPRPGPPSVFYPIPLQERLTPDGVRLEPSTRWIEVPQ